MATSGTRSMGSWQQAFLVLLRMAIGWHLLYEGLVKVWTPGWTSAPYLAELPLAPLGPLPLDRGPPGGPPCRGPAERLGPRPRRPRPPPRRLLPLRRALRDRPPRPLLRREPAPRGPAVERVAEGAYLIVNKNLVEILALCVVAAFPVGGFFGLERAASRLLARPPPSRPSGRAGHRRPAARPLPARADRRRGRPARPRRLRPRPLPEAELRQLRGEAPPRGRGRRRRGEQRDAQDLPLREPQGAEGPGPPRPARDAGRQPRDHGRQPHRGLGPRPRPALRLDSSSRPTTPTGRSSRRCASPSSAASTRSSPTRSSPA